jgi:tetratricopeptide (TPR) repeat protein
LPTDTADSPPWYSDFEEFLWEYFRKVDQELPGLDTVLYNFTTGEFYDVHWNYWSKGGSGGFSYTRTKSVKTVVASASYTDSILPPEIDISAPADGIFELCVSADIIGEMKKDCISFTKAGEDRIVINGTCNQPSVEQDVQAAIDALSELLHTGDDKTDKKIEKALKHLEKSLDHKLWETDSTLTKKGKKVFDEDKKAVKELKKIHDPAILDIIESIVSISNSLAQTAILEAEEAIAAGGSQKEIDKALKEIDKVQKEMAKAQKELDHTKKNGTLDPKYDKAIDHYKKAWEHAQHAMKKLSKHE